MKYNDLHGYTRWYTDFDRETLVYQHVNGLSQSFVQAKSPNERLEYNKSYTSKTNPSTYCNNKVAELVYNMNKSETSTKLQKLTPTEFAHDESMDIQNVLTY